MNIILPHAAKALRGPPLHAVAYRSAAHREAKSSLGELFAKWWRWGESNSRPENGVQMILQGVGYSFLFEYNE